MTHPRSILFRLYTFLRQCLADVGDFILPAETHWSRRQRRKRRREKLRHIMREPAGPRGFEVITEKKKPAP